MKSFLYIEINVIGSAILLLMFLNLNRKRVMHGSPDVRLFNFLIITNVLIFFFDTAMWLVVGKSFFLAHQLNAFVTAMYYTFCPFMCFIWLLYTDFKINEDRSALLKRLKFYLIPVCISAIISLSSPLTGLYFIIDESNIYLRGKLFPLLVVIGLGYLLYAIYISSLAIVKRGWSTNKNLFFYLTVFPSIVLVSALIQALIFELSIIWVCSTIVFFALYINIQNNELSTDYLTGLFNRHRADEYLRLRIKRKTDNSLLFVIILDVDSFKTINDTYGHLRGDDVLKQVSELLRLARGKKSYLISRFGGDEFMIVGECESRADIENLLSDITAQTDAFNRSGVFECKLSLSMGFAIYGEDYLMTADALVHAADKQMYLQKQARKKKVLLSNARQAGNEL
ncbi:MAG: GGDEF domain-containing protein [Oscillospiraceae bacterium]